MDDGEISFGERIVRLDGTVVEVFCREGIYDGTRIPANFLGVKVKSRRAWSPRLRTVARSPSSS